MLKKNEMITQTKQNFVDAFWSLYCEKRIEKITVKDITVKAGYNRSTFYEYFQDVYDVLEYIESALIPEADELPPISIQSKTHGLPMDVFLELYEENYKYYSVLLGPKGDAAFASKLKERIKLNIMPLFDLNPDVNRKELDYILEYTLSAMIGIMSYWFVQPEKMSSTELHELIHRLMEQGVVRQLEK